MPRAISVNFLIWSTGGNASLPVTIPFIPAFSHPSKTWFLSCALVKKLCISTNQVAWFGFKTDSLRSDIHIFKGNSTIHLLFDFCRIPRYELVLAKFLAINSFFLDYWHNMSHVIFASCYVRDTYWRFFFKMEKFAKLTCRENFR